MSIPRSRCVFQGFGEYFRKKVTKFDRIIDDTVDDYIDIINAIHTKR